jgi:hypothetical protein
VFHFYDLYYWFVSVGIIRTELPEKNRYTNFQDIITKRVEEIGENDWKHILTLIQLNYFCEKENKYVPKRENVAPYFIGHASPTYVSYFLETDFLLDSKTNKSIEEKKIIGVITARPLHVKINCSRKDAQFDVYYIDYLCVHKSKRKKNIAPQLIQTHEYNQSYNNRKICVSLFKREEELTGIIPLTVYKTYCFPLAKMVSATHFLNLDLDVHLLTGDKQNMYYFYNFIQEPSIVNKWSIIVYPEISNIIELVCTNNLLVKMLLTKGNILCVYIFRKTCLYIEKDKEVLCLIGSICSNELTKQRFHNGFYVALMSIIKDNPHFGYLTIEDVSDNTSIINEICANTHPTAISPMAYFFYNFAYSPFKSEKCFIIN